MPCLEDNKDNVDLFDQMRVTLKWCCYVLHKENNADIGAQNLLQTIEDQFHVNYG